MSQELERSVSGLRKYAAEAIKAARKITTTTMSDGKPRFRAELVCMVYEGIDPTMLNRWLEYEQLINNAYTASRAFKQGKIPRKVSRRNIDFNERILSAANRIIGILLKEWKYTKNLVIDDNGRVSLIRRRAPKANKPNEHKAQTNGERKSILMMNSKKHMIK